MLHKPGGEVAVFEKQPRQLDRIEADVQMLMQQLQEVLAQVETLQPRVAEGPEPGQADRRT